MINVRLSASTATTGTLAVRHLTVVDATSADCVRTLPSAASAGNGGRLVCLKMDPSVNTVTVVRDGSDTIAGAVSYTLREVGGVRLVSDGSATWTADRVH